MSISPLLKKGMVIITGLLCFTSWIGPSLALLLGIVTACSIGQAYKAESVQKITNGLLKASVIGLGFGMNFHDSVKAGREGLIFTIISIIATLGLGAYLAKKFSVDTKTSILISSGTAICGGSAIAAMSPVINADDNQTSVALGAVFILNSVALFLFPFAGHLLHLTQMEFGYWAAIAIHDTSSVVGAASNYGTTALSVATTVKLGRALWIIPLTFIASLIFKSGDQRVRIPYFILLFIGAMLLNTFIPSASVYTGWIVPAARKSLTLTLFLIGTGLSMRTLKGVGFRPLIKAVVLWLSISAGSLWMIVCV